MYKRQALADLIARVSVLADDLAEVASLVLNPVNAHPGGVEVLGAEIAVSYTHLRAHETVLDLVCRLMLEKKTYE